MMNSMIYWKLSNFNTYLYQIYNKIINMDIAGSVSEPSISMCFKYIHSKVITLKDKL